MYYYLISSLPELSQADGFSKHPYPVFHGFVQEELTQTDYGEMRRCFLFNDVRNLVVALTGGVPDSQASLNLSYYQLEDLAERLFDTESLLPVFGDFVWDYQNGLVKGNESHLEFELLNRLMESLPEEPAVPGATFVDAYLRFEMRLRNLSTALAYRSQGRDYSDKIVQFDYFSHLIATGRTEDFGLGGELGELAFLIQSFGSADPLKIEGDIAQARWNWLDEQIQGRTFHREAVFAYSLKIADVQRWLVLAPEYGQQRLDELLDNLNQEIRKSTVEETAI